MTELLEKAIAKLRQLPDSNQDEIAEVIMMMTEAPDEPVALDEETRAAILTGLDQVRRGQFASDERLAAIFRG